MLTNLELMSVTEPASHKGTCNSCHIQINTRQGILIEDGKWYCINHSELPALRKLTCAEQVLKKRGWQI